MSCGFVRMKMRATSAVPAIFAHEDEARPSELAGRQQVDAESLVGMTIVLGTASAASAPYGGRPAIHSSASAQMRKRASWARRLESGRQPHSSNSSSSASSTLSAKTSRADRAPTAARAPRAKQREGNGEPAHEPAPLLLQSVLKLRPHRYSISVRARHGRTRAERNPRPSRRG